MKEYETKKINTNDSTTQSGKKKPDLPKSVMAVWLPAVQCY